MTARYDDETWDAADKDKAIGLYTRRTEKPKIAASKTKPPTDGSIILLAEVKLAANGTTESINDTVSKAVGPNADSVVRTLTVQEDAIVRKRLTVTNASPLKTPAGANTLDLQRAERTNPAKHPADLALYVTATTNDKLVEFRHSNGTQGIGFRYSTIYATGSNEDQGLTLKARGKSSVTLASNTAVNGALTVENIADFKKGLLVDGDTIVKKSLTITGAAAWKTGSAVNTLDVQRAERTTYAGTGWKGVHPTDLALYVTADSGDANKLVEFRHSHGTQGIGFGCNTIYATGPYPDQPLRLKAFGKGRVEIQQQDWIVIEPAGAPKFQNDWKNYGGEFNTAAFFRDSLGIVHLKGLLTNSSEAGGKVIFQLPQGYRPAAQELRIIPTNNPKTDKIKSENDFGRLDVTKAGNVVPTTVSIGYWMTNRKEIKSYTLWVSLDGISFRAA